MFKPKLVNVLWIDSWGKAYNDLAPMKASTVGWLIGETEDYFYVSHTISELCDRQMGCLQIEKDQVEQVVLLEEIPLGEYNEVLIEDNDPEIEVTLEQKKEDLN